MSDPSTPSPAPAATAASVTPPGDMANANPIRLIHSTSDIPDLFLDILDEDETDRAKLKQGIQFLFIKHGRVRKWGDMKFFTSEDVETALHQKAAFVNYVNKCLLFFISATFFVVSDTYIVDT